MARENDAQHRGAIEVCRAEGECVGAAGGAAPGLAGSISNPRVFTGVPRVNVKDVWLMSGRKDPRRAPLGFRRRTPRAPSAARLQMSGVMPVEKAVVWPPPLAMDGTSEAYRPRPDQDHRRPGRICAYRRGNVEELGACAGTQIATPVAHHRQQKAI